ncbi:MAG: metallophosphoesterase family protein [Magnetovibrionaceae bacterium]
MMTSQTETNGSGGPATPTGLRIYAIGDLHGSLSLLTRLLEAIARDLSAHPPERCRIVFLGDYVDRGPEVYRLIDLLAQWPPPILRGLDVPAIFLKGNHEALMLDFLMDPAAGNQSGARAGTLWLMNGGDATVEAYARATGGGFSPTDALQPLSLAFAKSLPSHHAEFLACLETYHLAGDYLFVHAGVRPGTPLAEQAEKDMIWIREPFLSFDGPLDHHVVHGHTIVEEVAFRSNRTGIDTGAWQTGTLTALVLDGQERRLLQT